jgi:hypothetical protein
MGQQQHDRSQSITWTMDRPWRTGRKVQRNIYAMVRDEPDDQADVLIGQMDTGVLAVHVIESHNHSLMIKQRDARLSRWWEWWYAEGYRGFPPPEDLLKAELSVSTTPKTEKEESDSR